MPVRPHPEDGADSLLVADDGTALARMRIRDEQGERVAAAVEPLPGVAQSQLAEQARRDLAGFRLETSDDGVVAALVAGGLVLHRAATEMRHRLDAVPARVALPAGWSLSGPGWDDDLAGELAAAYGPGHPDGPWRASHSEQVRAMFDAGEPVPPLLPASARLVDPDGRSAGHVLCAGPVPWTDDVCAWILNLAVAPRAQGRGCGRALLSHALRGAREAGLPAVGLSVADGNRARRLYDDADFRPVARVLSVLLPALQIRERPSQPGGRRESTGSGAAARLRSPAAGELVRGHEDAVTGPIGEPDALGGPLDGQVGRVHAGRVETDAVSVAAAPVAAQDDRVVVDGGGASLGQPDRRDRRADVGQHGEVCRTVGVPDPRRLVDDPDDGRPGPPQEDGGGHDAADEGHDDRRP
ncbi:hypothetical protein GCM10017556_26300 [Micromonospora sagamiensis]|nr:hypothetical protein GCM10017556_26300 [Micromonospora sagamiensis]